MIGARVEASRGLRWGILALSAAFTLVTLGADSADARGRYRRVKHAAHERSGGSYSPPYAAIVVDGNSGRVLHAANPDSLRHPASITKIMTLYLLFEQLEAGKLRLDSSLAVSAHAAAQSPTKLDLKPGQTIAVEDAIKGLVTKSANDAAVVIGEAIGGSEDEFARMMTAKARTIGMSRTVYRNASGLPDDEQVTTARDQALLGRAIQERFPRYYRYFSTTSFRYRGEAMRNHNKLLGQVEGMDGIKTGYTQASGFNLVASVRRNNRHVVSVVMGGTSAGARDARMRSLIEEYIVAASPQKNVTVEVTAAKAQPAATRMVKEQAAKAHDPAGPTAQGARAADTRPAGGSGAPAIYSVASHERADMSPTSAAAPAVSTPSAVASSPPATESA